MKFIIVILLTALSTLNSTFANTYAAKYDFEPISQITKHKVKIPSKFKKYTMGFSPGIGSSITLKGILENGAIELYAVCDRGPNCTIAASNCTNDTIIFPKPDFSPFIGIIKIIPGKSAALTHIILLTLDGQKISGLPIPKMENIPNSSVPTDLKFKPLPADPKGFDTESIDVDAEGNFWIGDEYRPSLIKTLASGEIVEILTPGNGLPAILKNSPKNRGFEALAVAPNGKIYAAMESILDFGGNTVDSANFIRIIELDPKTRQTRTFAYPFDKCEYSFPLAAKLGDMAAIDNTHFLIIEQGKTRSGMRNIIYIIDIANATDISNLTLSNKLPLEYASFHELSEIQLVKKAMLFDAPSHTWPHEKLEGVAIINPKTLAISNDNDFGFSLSIKGTPTEHVFDYKVDYNTHKLLHHEKKTNNKVDVHIQKNATTEIWILEFKKNLLDFIDSSPN